MKTEAQSKVAPSAGYGWYALGVMVLVYAINFVDRQILSILAEDVKRTLNLTDSQLGYLYGTAFALFYALFGIPLGRLADHWHRVRLMSIGLGVWSVMTAACGFASGFVQLALFRVGVGTGEAAASPAAFSMLADYFPRRHHALAMSIYSAGLYLGMGFSLPLGGWISSAWDTAYPGHSGPLGLLGWQAAFVAIGLPGLMVAIWVWTLREPVRGASDGCPTPMVRGGAWRAFGAELASILPPFTLWSVSRYPGALRTNVIALVLVTLSVAVLLMLTGDAAQWVCYGAGLYAVFSWIQVLRQTDPPAYELIWGTPYVVLAIFGFGTLSFFTYAFSFWAAPYAIRTFAVSKAVVGVSVGIPGAIASAAGVVAGGRLSDAWKRHDPRGRVFVSMLAVILPAPFFAAMFSTTSFQLYVVLAACVYFLNSIWVGSTVAAYQDFVLPRMRGTAGATYLLGATMLGLALGPYFTGKVATLTGSLRAGAYSLYLIAPVTLLLLWIVSAHVAKVESTKFARAAAVGEPLAEV